MDVKCKSHLVACKFLGLEEPLKTRLPLPCGSIVLFPPCFLIIVNHWDLSPIEWVLGGQEKGGVGREGGERGGGGEGEEERRRRGGGGEDRGAEDKQPLSLDRKQTCRSKKRSKMKNMTTVCSTV